MRTYTNISPLFNIKILFSCNNKVLRNNFYKLRKYFLELLILRGEFLTSCMALLKNLGEFLKDRGEYLNNLGEFLSNLGGLLKNLGGLLGKCMVPKFVFGELIIYLKKFANSNVVLSLPLGSRMKTLFS